MEDLTRDYASDLKKLREAFHKELTATADKLSKPMGVYAHRGEAALATFMEKASARRLELEVSATARLNKFVGNGSLPGVDNIPLTLTPTNADEPRMQPLQSRRSRTSEGRKRGNHKPRPAAPLPRITREDRLKHFTSRLRRTFRTSAAQALRPSLR